MVYSIKNIIQFGIFGIYFTNESITGVPFMLGLLGTVLICFAAGYFCGSFSPAIILSQILYKKDIRGCEAEASASGMFAVFGKKAGILTVIATFVKALVSLTVGYCAFGYSGAWLAGLFCILGSVFPIFYRFKGDKGILTGAFVLLLTDWPVFVICAIVYIIVLIGTEMISMASIMSALTMPLFLYEVFSVFYGDGSSAGIRVPIALIISVVLVLRHIENIRNIRAGKEPKVVLPWKKNKDKTDKRDKMIEKLPGGIKPGKKK